MREKVERGRVRRRDGGEREVERDLEREGGNVRDKENGILGRKRVSNGGFDLV